MLKTILLFAVAVLLQMAVVPAALQAQNKPSSTRSAKPVDLTQVEPVQSVTVDWTTEKEVTVGGRVFSVGGVMAPSRAFSHVSKAVFDNKKHYDVFEAWVGFSGDPEDKSILTFVVSGDGKELFRSTEMRIDDPAIRVSLPIKNFRGVALAVYATNVEYDSNRAIWGDPTFRMGKPAKDPTTATTTPAASAPTGTIDDTTPDAAPVKNKLLQISPARMDELATKLKAALAKDPVFSKSRPTLAIANFKLIPANALDPTNADNVREDLSTAIISTDTFNVVERGQLDQALKELKIGLNDTFDSATAQKLGKLVSAQVVLIGSISDRGSFVVINARLIDTATGRARAAANVEVR